MQNDSFVVIIGSCKRKAEACLLPYSLPSWGHSLLIAECQGPHHCRMSGSGPQARDVTWAKLVYARQSIPAPSRRHSCCTDHFSTTNSGPLKL